LGFLVGSAGLGTVIGTAFLTTRQNVFKTHSPRRTRIPYVRSTSEYPFRTQRNPIARKDILNVKNNYGADATTDSRY
jgi:hypothetical protein